MIFTYRINELLVRTGDILCTTNGAEASIDGMIWRMVGALVPGIVDHALVYVGPGGRCVEAGPHGVIAFELPPERWDSEPLFAQRGFLDQLHGAAYPLANSKLAPGQQALMRRGVADYCLAQIGKPYNFDFFDTETEEAFYCSQLPYRAYLSLGIDMKGQQVVSGLEGSELIVLPQEIWNASPHRLAVS